MRDRLLVLLDTKDPKAEDILRFFIEEIKAVGIFRQKAQYIHNIADLMIAYKITHSKLAKMGNEEIIELISQIKGVGRWTVEMLLMFGLGREDVFAVDDLGI
jgi:DNA-3-methyladenine glycosylase II